jgi:hypothetical protein
MKYTDFLAQKRAVHTPFGFGVDELHSQLFLFQRDIVRWAIQRGRAALFLDTGLGKTLCQLEWARRNLLAAESQAGASTLFDLLEREESG